MSFVSSPETRGRHERVCDAAQTAGWNKYHCTTLYPCSAMIWMIGWMGGYWLALMVRVDAGVDVAPGTDRRLSSSPPVRVTIIATVRPDGPQALLP
ncbi:hypothetical protein BP00DRAFT_429065 [Aspergillus indologenus CBS 114.80]|uniref:Uncharacterized protein n=1 Tax=Aspergillus indologenus CBS 114.80 TaxID=1450541 RepID=A0A2V5IGR7_9EURO|nr:hypothetical protein BP00DRAFT_429065 [Aspergillus indologenus CBS 114.80]